MCKYFLFLITICSLSSITYAQENSPYSRYGLGDIAPNQNIFSRGMGGISAGVVDYQSINFANPASLANLQNTIFDLATEIDNRTLKSTNPLAKSNSTNSIFSYLQLGFPIATQKMRKKNINWGMSFGLKPITKINYKIFKAGRLSGIDSINTTYEGTGGLNQAFLGTGIKIKNLSFGLNAGYMFGTKNYSTRVVLVNDSIDYYKSNSANQTTINGFFLSGGLQYEIDLNKNNKNALYKKLLRLGVYGNVQQKLNASRDDIRETYTYDGSGNTIRVDSVYDQKNIKGKIQYPSSYGIGFSYLDAHWLIGADYETTKWSNYTYYGQSDLVQNNWTIRVGGQYFPAKIGTPIKKYFNFVKYRAGFYYGNDYIKINDSRPAFGFTLGTGMPLTSLQKLSYFRDDVTLNTALEVGGRGDKNSNFKESIVRFSIGISMNAHWFIKRKYD